MSKAIDEDAIFAEIMRRLTREFPHTAPDSVKAVIDNERSRFCTSPVRDFIPLFVERAARQKLTRA